MQKRTERRQIRKGYDYEKDKAGFERYKQDTKEIEEYKEKVQTQELQHARDSYLKL